MKQKINAPLFIHNFISSNINYGEPSFLLQFQSKLSAQVMGQKVKKWDRGVTIDDDHDDNEFDGGGNDCADDDDADAIGGG